MKYAGLVLGIASLVAMWFSSFVGLGCGIVGIILSALANKKEKSGVGTAGLVCSIIATAISAIFVIMVIWLIIAVASLT